MSLCIPSFKMAFCQRGIAIIDEKQVPDVFEETNSTR